MRPNGVATTILLGFAILLASDGTPVSAGPNQGGTLIVHLTEPGRSIGTGPADSAPLSDCASAITQAPTGVYCTWWVFAAFPTSAQPRLSWVALRERLDPSLVIISSGLPPDLEVTEYRRAGWPSADGGIVSLHFRSPQTEHLVPLYWFIGYAQDRGRAFRLERDPGSGPFFHDDAAEPNRDAILGFGSLGFGVRGENACPDDGLGACCTCRHSCVISTPAACEALDDGVWYSIGTGCDPNPCASVGTDGGACCLPDGSCVFTAWGCECRERDGIYLGEQTDCAASPCSSLTAACCACDGTCRVRTREECLGDLNTLGWMLGRTCEPNTCPPPVGSDDWACCLPDGSCVYLDGCHCYNRGGSSKGPGVECEPNPCLVPVEKSSWGRIKATFR